MAHEAHWGRKFSLPIMLRSDMVSIGDQGTSQRRRDVDTFNMLGDNGMVTASWGQVYLAIGACNQAIAGAQTLRLLLNN